MKKVLIINAHQFYDGFSAGSLNNALVDVIGAEMQGYGYAVQHTSIEKGYSVQDEVDKHLWADIIILQSPVYWFGSPWIYKKYVDEVFTAGLVAQVFLADDGRSRFDVRAQYGSGGFLQGKKYMVSLTWNAPEEAFGDKEQLLFSGKTVDDVLAYNTANYRFCGIDILPSFSCFDVIKAPQIENDFKRLRSHLAAVVGPVYSSAATELVAEALT